MVRVSVKSQPSYIVRADRCDGSTSILRYVGADCHTYPQRTKKSDFFERVFFYLYYMHFLLYYMVFIDFYAFFESRQRDFEKESS